MHLIDICFLSSMHSPFDKRVFDKEAVALAKKGYAVTHLCPDAEAGGQLARRVTIRTYTRRLSGIRGRIMQLVSLYRLAASQRARVYHCNEVDSWLLGVLLRLFKKSRCIFDVHEHYPSTFAESRFPRWSRPAVELAIRLLFRVLTPFTDRIVLAKRSVAPDFAFAENKIVLVQNFTPLASIRLIDEIRPLKAKGDPLRLIHLGLISRIRGWPQLLEGMAVAKAKNMFLEVIGEFNDGTRKEFEAAIDGFDLRSRVSVTDWMPFEEAFKRLSKADIGIVAFQPGIQNHVFALPHKMFDYMAAGNAVLCPGFALEIAPVVLEARCGLLIDPASPADIAAKLDQLAENPVAIAEMGQRGRRAVVERYNWEQEAEKLCRMYQELLSVAR